MDYLPLGVMLVAPDGTLDQANQAAQRMLSRGDAFQVEEGKLRLVDPHLQDNFATFRRGSGPERMLMRMIRRHARREPHLVLAQQVADGEAVLLLVMDGEDRGRLTEKMLMASLGLTRAEARVHFQRNIVLRAMGIESHVDVDTFTLDVEDGDRFIMCSDGLVDEAPDEEIEIEIRQSNGVQDLANRLVDLANRNGGRDNITVVVVDFDVVEHVIETPQPEVVEPEVVAEAEPVVAEPRDHAPASKPSPWFSVASWSMFVLSAAIAITVVVSAIVS